MSATAVETITIRVDSAPAKEMLGLGTRWWRWQHHTRENWRRRVLETLDTVEIEGFGPENGITYRLLSVHVDWGQKTRLYDEQGLRALLREIAGSLVASGLTLEPDFPTAITQDGIHAEPAHTVMTLEPVSV